MAGHRCGQAESLAAWQHSPINRSCVLAFPAIRMPRKRSLRAMTILAPLRSPTTGDKSRDALASVLLQCSPDCVKLLDARGNVTFFNESGLCAMEIDDFEMVRGMYWPISGRARAALCLIRSSQAPAPGQPGRSSPCAPPRRVLPSGGTSSSPRFRATVLTRYRRRLARYYAPEKCRDHRTGCERAPESHPGRKLRRRLGHRPCHQHGVVGRGNALRIWLRIG